MYLSEFLKRTNKWPRHYVHIFLVVTSAISGWIFSNTGIPLAWLIGPLITVVLCILGGMENLMIPVWFRRGALIVIGAALGLKITPDMGKAMMDHLGLMLTTTLIMIMFSLVTAWMLHRKQKVEQVTAIFSSIPGGLSEMISLGQSQGGNLQIISMFHSIRVMMIVLLNPFLITLLPLQTGGGMISVAALNQIVLAILPTIGIIGLGAVGAFLARRIKIPSPYLLGSLSVVALLSLTSFETGTPYTFSDILMNTAQLIFGISIGGEWKRAEVIKNRVMFFYGFMYNMLLWLFSIVVAAALAYFTGIPFTTWLLAAAPGGLAEMSVTALEIGADALFVTSFQLFRIVFIVTIFSFCIRWYLKGTAAKA
ncbi:AbrB family transcriptional regulator [Brevibacillus daliensis]|uniref:AbrB family transcriptional regulator n=1 Tax=Brevibacillus daliensis TaxID=2892995 RepID=UPI001E584366|nr:AbrB family transcriptional regulator [Brevibacillus daliensis]